MTHTQPEKTRSLFSDSLYLFLIRFFPTLASFLVLIFYSRLLPAHVYGAYQKFWVDYYVLSAIACTGLHVLILTYTPSFLTRLLQSIPLKKILWPASWLLLTGAVYSLLEAHTFAGYILPAVFLVVFSITAIAESALVVFKQFRLLLWSNIVYAFIFLWLHWYVLQPGTADMHSLLWAVTVIALLRLPPYAGYLMALIKKQAALIAYAEEDKITLKTVRSLWLHMGLYDVIQVLFRWADKFIIALVLSSGVSAIYFNGSVDVPFLPVVLGAVGSAGLMRMAAAGYGRDKELHFVQLLHASSRMLACVVLPLFFFLLLFRREIFAVVFSHRYDLSVPVFLFSILTIPVRAYNFTTVLQHYHKGNIINAGAVLDLVLACLLMYPLYLLMGLPGVALAFSITTFIQAAFYLYHSARLLGVPVMQLLPVRNLLLKAIVFSVFFISLYNIAHACFTPQIALFLGCTSFIVVSLAALLIELKQDKRNNGKKLTQE